MSLVWASAAVAGCWEISGSLICSNMDMTPQCSVSRQRKHATGCTELGEEGELALYNPRSGARKQFKYDRVFGCDSTQEEVYEDTKALIRSVLDGALRCISGNAFSCMWCVREETSTWDSRCPMWDT